MPWTVDYISELGIVNSTYVGNVTADEFRMGTVRSLNLARENNTRLFLIDDSKWEGGTSVFDLYKLPALFIELGFERGSKGALILPPSGNAESTDAHFFETVCVNQGWLVKVFADRQEAINWLTTRKLSNKPDARDGL